MLLRPLTRGDNKQNPVAAKLLTQGSESARGFFQLRLARDDVLRDGGIIGFRAKRVELTKIPE